ncbi:MAG: hypothetical protein EBR09_13085 [Proteobacteria bacterium]|jgi:hypothetical protein|nr:hypothetical protein [Pseudomonadota bacterium]
MLDVLEDEELFWQQQCYNPHARQWTYQWDQSTRRSPYNLYCEMVTRAWCELHWDEDAAQRYRRPAWRALPLNYDAAFGARPYETWLKSMCARQIHRPEAVTVLCYAARSAPDHVHFAPHYRAQLWAFRKIKTAALERYLRGVRAVLRPHALGNKDVTDMICACLAAWHASLPHEDALPRVN